MSTHSLNGPFRSLAARYCRQGAELCKGFRVGRRRRSVGERSAAVGRFPSPSGIGQTSWGVPVSAIAPAGESVPNRLSGTAPAVRDNGRSLEAAARRQQGGGGCWSCSVMPLQAGIQLENFWLTAAFFRHCDQNFVYPVHFSRVPSPPWLFDSPSDAAS